MKRTIDLETISITTSANVNRAYTIKFNQLPNFTEFTNLFQRYRFNRIVFRMEPLFNNYQFTAAATQAYVPKVVDAVDTSGGSVLASDTDYYQYANRHEVDGSKVWFRSFVPSGLDDVGGIVSAAPKYKQWLSVKTPDIQHGSYMMGIFVEPATVPNYAVRVSCTVYFSVAGVR